MNGKRHILRRIRLREISGVDRPAQEGAVAVLVKMNTMYANGEEPLVDDDEKMKPAEGAAPEDGDKPNAAVDAPVAPEDKETDMDELAKAKARIQELESALSKAQNLATLTDVERSYANALRSDERDGFLAKGASARQAEIKEAVVYTATDGTPYLRTDDQRLVKMAKERDEDHKRHNELIEKAENAEFAKRAREELKHLPLDEAAGAALLKAVSGIKDDKVREVVEKGIKAHDGKMAEVFVEKGTNPGSEPVTKKASEAFDDAVVKFAKANSMNPEDPGQLAKATRAFAQTAEGRKLYKAMNPAPAPQPTN